MPSLPRAFALAVASLSLLGAVASTACNLLPDECQFDDNVCEGNVANQCYRPGPESRLRTSRIDCGDLLTCVLTPNAESKVAPVCAEKGLPDCPTVNAEVCHGDSVAFCMVLLDGGKTWVDNPPCPKGCHLSGATDPDPGAECNQ